jgi:tryptophanyl-tRNA synthetase
MQHLEMTRDIAARFNNKMGETFVIPKVQVQKDTMLVPGTDGEKMSKSRNNFINIFLPEKELRKQVLSIQTDSKELDEPKDPKTCNVYSLYKLIANSDQILEMKKKYASGGYGYGHAKQELFEIILKRFSAERTLYDELMKNPSKINAALEIGAIKARSEAKKVLKRVRDKVGY